MVQGKNRHIFTNEDRASPLLRFCRNFLLYFLVAAKWPTISSAFLVGGGENTFSVKTSLRYSKRRLLSTNSWYCFCGILTEGIGLFHYTTSNSVSFFSLEVNVATLHAFTTLPLTRWYSILYMSMLTGTKPWTTYTFAQDHFMVKFPALPIQESANPPIPESNLTMPLHRYTAQAQDGTYYQVDVHQWPSQMVSQHVPNDIFQASLQCILQTTQVTLLNNYRSCRTGASCT
mgnify:CR=1 FL=1